MAEWICTIRSIRNVIFGTDIRKIVHLWHRLQIEGSWLRLRGVRCSSLQRATGLSLSYLQPAPTCLFETVGYLQDAIFCEGRAVNL